MNNSYMKSRNSRCGFGIMNVVGFATVHLAFSGALTIVRQSQGTLGTADIE